jgi:hypothetical protein
MLELVESKGPLNYTRTGNFPEHEVKDGIQIFGSGLMLPNLGKASADSWVACNSYLVWPTDKTISLRTLQGYDGVGRVCVDQLINPDTISFTPGGLWSDDVVLQGRIATVSSTPVAQGLMERFHRAIKKTFTKVTAWHIGPMAMKLLRGGKRLTQAVQTPRKYDLVLPEGEA